MIKLVFLCALIVLMIPTVVFANGDVSRNNTPTESSASQAEKTLKTYLDAAKQENIGQMVSSSVDTRFTQATVDAAYKHAFEYKRDQLLSYTLTSETQNSDGFEFMTELSFSDGNTLNVPFEVVQKNNSWKVLITPNSLKQNLKSINYVAKPNSSSDTTSSATVSPNTAGQIATWSITDMLMDGSYSYSSSTFSPNSDGYNQCTLNLQQRSAFSGVLRKSNTLLLLHIGMVILCGEIQLV